MVISQNWNITDRNILKPEVRQIPMDNKEIKQNIKYMALFNKKNWMFQKKIVANKIEDEKGKQEVVT